MKVLMVADSVYGNGIGITVYRLYNSLIQRDIQCDIVCYQNLNNCKDLVREIESKGNHIYSIPSISAGPIKYINSIKSICRNKYDVIHIHTSLLIFLAAYAAKKEGVPVRIGHGHGAKFFNYPESILMFLEPIGRFLNRLYCTDFVTCSQVSAQYTFGRNGVLIPNYVPVEEILNVDEMLIQDIKHEYSNGDELVFGYMGSLDGEKNVVFLPSVISQLNKLGINAKLLLIGEGKMRENIENEAKKYNCSDKIVLLGRRNDTRTLVQIFDYYISASKTEGMSLSMIEAQMAGKPCFASDLIPDYSDLKVGLFKQISGFDSRKWAISIKQSIENGLSPIDRVIALKKIESKGMSEKTIIDRLIEVYKGKHDTEINY